MRILRKKLRQIELEVDSHLKQDHVCCGMTLSQCHTLLEIGDKRQISVVELASASGLDTSTLSRTIDGMVNIGLVERKANTSDRRYVSISLSPQGKKLYRSIEKFFNDFFMRIFDYIPEEKHEHIVDSLFLFFDALKKYKESKACCNNQIRDRKLKEVLN